MDEGTNIPPGENARPISPAPSRALLQYIYPQRLLCALMYLATRVRYRPWKNWQIQWFIRRYGVDMSEAVISDTARFPDFNSFFTRALRPEARPVDDADDTIVSPADGTVGHFGRIRGDVLIQAKGLEYSLARLMGATGRDSDEFEDGSFLTIYLAPGNYHRVHMPLNGVLRRSVHVPGRLFSVGTETTRRIPKLFARNERMVSIFDVDRGPIAIVMVGALFVGGIEQVWADPPRPSLGRRTGVCDYRSRSSPLSFRKAEEMGRFNMGSTVVALFGPSLGIEWTPELHPGNAIRMGERIAKLRPLGLRSPASDSMPGLRAAIRLARRPDSVSANAECGGAQGEQGAGIDAEGEDGESVGADHDLDVGPTHGRG